MESAVGVYRLARPWVGLVYTHSVTIGTWEEEFGHIPTFKLYSWSGIMHGMWLANVSNGVAIPQSLSTCLLSLGIRHHFATLMPVENHDLICM